MPTTDPVPDDPDFSEIANRSIRRSPAKLGSPDESDHMSTNRPRVAVTRSDLPGTGIERLSRSAELTLWPSRTGPSPDELAGFIGQADGLLSMSQDHITDTVLEQAPRLVVIGQASAGFDNLDLDALTRRGVQAANAPGVLQETTADFSWALIMATCRRLVEADQHVRTGRWTEVRFDLLLGQDLYGATLGVIGYGQIGKAVARRAQGFEMTVIHTDPVAPSDTVSQAVALDDLLRQADIVSIHTVLTEHTHHLISDRELDLMKPTAVLVNASRGPVVDQRALVEALRSGTIWAAGLDVFEGEPVTADNPLVALPNCVLAPHIASASLATRTRMVDVAVENLLAGLRGERLPNLLNTDVTARSPG